jgi:hypothetical protein
MSQDGQRARRRRRDATPDAHLFPTRRYDLVKEFVIAVVVVGVLVVALALVFSGPGPQGDHARGLGQRGPERRRRDRRRRTRRHHHQRRLRGAVQPGR